MGRGKITRIRVNIRRECPCRAEKSYARKWFDDKKVPKLFQQYTFDDLKETGSLSRFVKFTRHREIFFEKLRELFLDGYSVLLVGPGGCGKTTIMMAFYESAVRNMANHGWYERNVWSFKANELATFFRAKATRIPGDETPFENLITPQALMFSAARGQMPTVLIDEIDKFNPTDFQKTQLHELLNACWESKGQLIATSNLSLPDLQARLGPQYSEPVLRRIMGSPKGLLVDFFRMEMWQTSDEGEKGIVRKSLLPQDYQRTNSHPTQKTMGSVNKVGYSVGSHRPYTKPKIDLSDPEDQNTDGQASVVQSKPTSVVTPPHTKQKPTIAFSIKADRIWDKK